MSIVNDNMNTKSGALPTHQFILIDSSFTHENPIGWIEGWWTYSCE